MTSQTDRTATSPTAIPDVALMSGETVAMVERALRRCGEDFYRAVSLPANTQAEQAERAADLAEVAARRVHWWGVLIRHVLSADSGVSWVYASAARAAQRHEESEAQLWADTAHYLATESITTVGAENPDATEGPVRVQFRFRSAS
jgi:hypothetical protein